MIYIYALLDKPDNVFYIGQTVDPMRRLKEHRCSFEGQIILKVLQEVETQEHADEMEAAWIWLYSQRYQLRNIQHNRRKKDGLPLGLLMGINTPEDYAVLVVRNSKK